MRGGARVDRGGERDHIGLDPAPFHLIQQLQSEIRPPVRHARVHADVIGDDVGLDPIMLGVSRRFLTKYKATLYCNSAFLKKGHDY